MTTEFDAFMGRLRTYEFLDFIRSLNLISHIVYQTACKAVRR